MFLTHLKITRKTYYLSLISIIFFYCALHLTLHQTGFIKIFDSITYVKYIVHNNFKFLYSHSPLLIPHTIAYITTNSSFSIHFLSILFFVAGLMLIYNLLNLFHIPQKTCLLAIIFIALTPNNLVFNSTVMPESIQLLTTSGYILACLHFIKDSSNKNIFLLICAQWLCSFSHTGMGLFIFIHTLILCGELFLKKICNHLIITLLIFNSALTFHSDFAYTYIKRSFLHSNIEASKSKFTVLANLPKEYASHSSGRSDYFITKQTYSKTVYCIYKFLCYLFGPFVFEIHTLADLIYALCALARTIMLFTIAFYIKPLVQRGTELNLMLSAAICLTILYALATHNYGTAFRHNITTDWLIVALFTITLFLRRPLDLISNH